MVFKRILLPLIPAILVAQAPDAQSFSQRLRAEAPVIDQLLANARPLDARSKAEGLLPAQAPVWDEANPQTQVTSFYAFKEYVYAYYLASKAADASGDWEKSLEYLQSARNLSQVNADKAGVHFPAIISYYKDMAERSRKTLADNADYIKSLQAKANPDAGDLQQLELVKKEGESIEQNATRAQNYGKALEGAKQEAAYYASQVGLRDGEIKALAKSLDEYTFKNDKVKYVEGIMSAKGYLETQYPDKAARVRFLYRLRTLSPGDRKVLKSLNELTGTDFPLPPEEKPTPRRRRK
nr:hypothetical protein [uncultured Holophaga sp.]